MTNLASDLTHRLRQWRFPRAFRIESNGRLDPAELLCRLVKDALRAPEPALSRDPPSPAKPASAALGEGFLVSLCNNNFRLRRNVELLEKEGESSKELRSIRRTLDTVEMLLESAGVESIDLTGQEYDDGRMDFSALASEGVAGLDREQISLCERPLVLVQGKMIQKATGIVARPV